MARHAPARPGRSPRELVRFYLLDHETPLGKAIDVALLGLNLVFVGLFVVDTYPIGPSMRESLWRLEVGIAVVFLAEYLLRLYGAESRLAEFANAYTMVDLLAILPTLAVVALPGVTETALQIGLLRVLRVVRVLRFYRFTRDAEFFFGTITQETLRAVKLLLTVLVIFFVTAGAFYSFESGVNPAIRNFGDAFYFAVVTLTTVGFGDVTPVTQAGRWVTVSAILIGIVTIPRQAGQIIREWTYREKVNATCPECGLSYHDADASHCKSCGHVIYLPFDSRR